MTKWIEWNHFEAFGLFLCERAKSNLVSCGMIEKGVNKNAEECEVIKIQVGYIPEVSCSNKVWCGRVIMMLVLCWQFYFVWLGKATAREGCEDPYLALGGLKEIGEQRRGG